MILIIDNYDSFTYNLYQLITKKEKAVKVVRNDKITLKAIEDLSPSGIVFSPGPGRPEDAGECIKIIRYFSGKIPLLGVCLGHQAMAVAFGGDIIKSKEIMHGKRSMIFHNRKTLYKGIPLPFEAGRYHSLIVNKATLPDVFHINAETSNEIIMGIKHKEHLTFGVQFHPESLLSPSGEKIVNHFLMLCEEESLVC